MVLKRRIKKIKNNVEKEEKKKLIPKGIYCDSNGEQCPWLRYIGERKLHAHPPSVEYKLCPESDECEEHCWTIPITYCWQSQSVVRCEYMDFTDWDEETLLWDGVKECGVNKDWEEEERDSEKRDGCNEEECDLSQKGQV